MSDAEQPADDESEGWQYAVTPASEDEQREITRREMKMKADNGEDYSEVVREMEVQRDPGANQTLNEWEST